MVNVAPYNRFITSSFRKLDEISLAETSVITIPDIDLQPWIFSLVEWQLTGHTPR